MDRAIEKGSLSTAGHTVIQEVEALMSGNFSTNLLIILFNPIRAGLFSKRSGLGRRRGIKSAQRKCYFFS